MLPRTKTILASCVSVAIVAGVGVGVAEASSTPTTNASATASATSTGKAGVKGAHRGLRSRIAHGQITLDGPHHATVDLQRGVVQAAGPTSLTVRSDDGFTEVYTVTSSTKVDKQKAASSIGEVAVGDHVFVAASGSGSPETALRVHDSGAS